MKLFFSCIIFFFLPIVTLGQERAVIDPQSMKLDQIKKGMTLFINELEQQKERLNKYESALNDKSNSQEMDKTLAEISTEMARLLNKIEENYKNLSDFSEIHDNELLKLSQKFTLLEKNLEDTNAEVAELKGSFDKVEGEGRIVKNSDGSAKVFRLDTLTDYITKLPAASNCSENGMILETFFARSLNSLFVLSNESQVMLCKLEYGQNSWSVMPVSVADRGHVIEKE